MEPRADILQFMVKIAPAHKNHTVRANKGTGVKAQAFRALNNNRNAIPMSVSRSRDRALSNGSNTTGVSPYIYLRTKTVSSSETSFCFCFVFFKAMFNGQISTAGC